MVGNSPEVVSGTLLRRTDSNDVVPHILFVFTAVSFCLQIDLRSDHKEDHIPCSEVGAIKLKWRTSVGNISGGDSLAWEYSEPTHFNWSSSSSEPQPIDAMSLDFNPTSLAARFEPTFRKSALMFQ